MPKDVDGVDVGPVLRGVGDVKRRAVFWHYPHYANQGGPPGGAIRFGDWKLIEWYEDGKVEMFNLRDDVGEKKDLSKEMAQKAGEMKMMLGEWRERVGAQMPGRK